MGSNLLASTSSNVLLKLEIVTLAIELDCLYKTHVFSPGPTAGLLTLTVSFCFAFVSLSRIFNRASHLNGLRCHTTGNWSKILQTSWVLFQINLIEKIVNDFAKIYIFEILIFVLTEKLFNSSREMTADIR